MKFVELKSEERFKHYSIVWFFGMIAVCLFMVPLLGRHVRGNEPYFFGVIAAIIAWLANLMQRRALQYSSFATNRSAAENYKAVLAVAESKGWELIHYRNDRLLVMSVPGFPSSLLSWGERVTVEFLGTVVDVNSICDPAMHASVVSFGRNRKNVQAVMAAVCGCDPDN